ncbi:hypothetical protein J7E50_25830 [Pedobacter sp. ISL-68]|uniref:hypothetical protein n=1 Tax=unclassified Pedobacter TaxID=2628915 RepID=UPI001BEACD52|nr:MULTISPECIES: hypothetical protein [unclassified Pedobacter]MBT2564662.1 hypothetical protein [Pedobacter sp. ISL-64]MBT2593661.1 hypothetical protein [Pedobacter sp. ISL-68]
MENSNGRSPPTAPRPRMAQDAPRLKAIAPIGDVIGIILNNYLNQKIMKTNLIENGKSNGQLANTPKALGTDVNIAQDGSNGKGAEAKKDDKEINGAVNGEVKREEVKDGAGKHEPTKTEIREQLAEQKPAMNLEQVLKMVESLHRKKIQRDKLVETITTLEEFEVKQLEDAEETGIGQYQRCELVIEDDKGNEFKTKNPFIIKEVAERVRTLCVGRLSEIEGEMVVPA